MAMFVQLGPKNPAFTLVTVVSEIIEGELKTNLAATPLGKLAVAKKYGELMDAAIFDKKEKILAGSAMQLEAAFFSAFAMLQTVLRDDRERFVGRLADLLCSSSKDNVESKLRLLTGLFNSCTPTAMRTKALVPLLKFALETGNAALLVKPLSKLDSWVTEWELTPADASELYLLALHVMEAAEEPTQPALIKYLQSVDMGGNNLSEAKDLASRAVVTALQGEQLDVVYELPIVRALESDDKHKLTFALIKIFATGSLQDYRGFHKSNSAHIEALGLQDEVLVRRITVLTIAQLAFGNEVISYKQLQEALGLADCHSVEEAVIDAVSNGVLEARLDQEKEEVLIERSTHAFRTFTIDSWKVLRDKLSLWHNNVDEVVRCLHQAQARDDDDHNYDDEEEDM